MSAICIPRAEQASSACSCAAQLLDNPRKQSQFRDGSTARNFAEIREASVSQDGRWRKGRQCRTDRGMHASTGHCDTVCYCMCMIGHPACD